MDAPAASDSAARGRVLIVDDEEDIREIVTMVLESEGYEVRAAADGLAALNELDAWAPDVILLDIRMPRMDGFAFAEEYGRRPGPRVPVIVITATHDAAIPAADIGAAGYLPKPFLLEDLLTTVQGHVGLRPPSADRPS